MMFMFIFVLVCSVCLCVSCVECAWCLIVLMNGSVLMLVRVCFCVALRARVFVCFKWRACVLKYLFVFDMCVRGCVFACGVCVAKCCACFGLLLSVRFPCAIMI